MSETDLGRKGAGNGQKTLRGKEDLGWGMEEGKGEGKVGCVPRSGAGLDGGTWAGGGARKLQGPAAKGMRRTEGKEGCRWRG